MYKNNKINTEILKVMWICITVSTFNLKNHVFQLFKNNNRL